MESAEEALHPTKEMQQLYDESSAITHLTQDDPPLYMIYSEPDIVPPANSRPGQLIHHPNFGKQLKKAMDELGIENVYVHTSESKGRNPLRDGQLLSTVFRRCEVKQLCLRGSLLEVGSPVPNLLHFHCRTQN